MYREHTNEFFMTNFQRARIHPHYRDFPEMSPGPLSKTILSENFQQILQHYKLSLNDDVYKATHSSNG